MPSSSGPTIATMRERLRAQLARRNAQHETEIWILVNPRHAAALICGVVPQTVTEQASDAINCMARAIVDNARAGRSPAPGAHRQQIAGGKRRPTRARSSRGRHR
jgi:hypothetical protein